MRLPMPWIGPFATLLVLGISMSPGMAADAKAEQAAAGRADTDVMSRVLPEVSLQDVPFDDVIDFLRDTSGFQAVIVRDPGVPEGQPVIRLRLKSVPLEQVLQVLCTAHPEISIEPVENPKGPVVQVIRIHATEETDAVAREGPKIVRVYPLTKEIMSVLRVRGELAGPPEKEQARKGLDHVLSLIKAVVEAAGDRVAPTLAVHEETQSLILTGTSEQHARVQDTLAALRGEERPYDQQQTAATRAGQQLREMRAQTDDQIAKLRRENLRLEADLAEARDVAHKADEKARQQSLEVERMLLRLEEAQTRGIPSPQTVAPPPVERNKSDGASSAPSGAK